MAKTKQNRALPGQAKRSMLVHKMRHLGSRPRGREGGHEKTRVRPARFSQDRRCQRRCRGGRYRHDRDARHCAREVDHQAGTEPLHWRLLTDHAVASVEEAWRIVEWYKRRWLIEQFHRVLKTQGFKLEDSQIATADRLLKLVAIAAKAAIITIQLLQARDGRSHQPVRLAFDANEVATLAALNQNLEAQSKRLRNPHPPDSLAWAAWIIGRLGGWDG